MALAALGRIQEVNADLDGILAIPPHPVRTPGAVMRETALELRAHGFEAASDDVFRRTIAYLDAVGPGGHGPDSSSLERLRTLYAGRRWSEARILSERLTHAHPADVWFLGIQGALAAYGR